MSNPDFINEEFISKSFEDTFECGKKIINNVQAPYLIGLEGNLGAGKTMFTKGLASGLGISEIITSPTFLGISEYYSGTMPFIHMDFYQKVISKNLIFSFLEKPSILVIEWYKNFYEVYNDNLPFNLIVNIEFITGCDDYRKIILNKYS